MRKDNFLFISDVHEPYAHPNALKFCKMLQKDFDIPHENVYSVGDLLDLYSFSRWPKSPDAKHTINQELDLARERLRKWAIVFPEMKICESNHDQRIMRKALGAELPSQVIKSLKEIFELPDQWRIETQFVIGNGNDSMLICHGEEYADALLAAIAYGLNVVQGHHHQKAGVQYMKSRVQQLWGLATGCLVDAASFAFDYGDKNKRKPVIGCGIVINGVPHFVPLD